jgi:hypothetical protein
MLTLLPDGEPANINGVAYVADLQRACAMPTRADIEIRELGPEEWISESMNRRGSAWE